MAKKPVSKKPNRKTKKQNSSTTLLQFDNNRLLIDLFGNHSSHLTRVEHHLGVHVNSRGNVLAIEGDGANRSLAKQVFEGLYARLEQGLEVSEADVDGALRLACAPADELPSAGGTSEIQTQTRKVSPRSPTQARYIQAMNEAELTFGIGPAGTGKTYLAVAMAVSWFIKGRVDRIILSRPAVEAGERLGFLPGDMIEKVDPYLRPLYDALYDTMAPGSMNRNLETGTIEVAPLAFMRGRTLANAFIILDEAQNCSAMQMKMFLTRLGENSRMVITGDPTQVDLPAGTKSGLDDALQILEQVSAIEKVYFTEADVVRHPMVTKIVQAYNAADKKSLSAKK